MRRRELITLLGGTALTWPLGARAQQKAMPRIGYLAAGSSVNPAFREGLRERGYVEGQNIAIELRSANLDLGRLPRLAAELVELKVDVIVTVTTPAAAAAKAATSTIPIVMATAGNPIRSGLVASLARPGGNVTGLSFLGDEVAIKNLELLKEVAPGSTKLALIMNPDVEPERTALTACVAAAGQLGMEIKPFAVRKPDEFEAAFAAISEWQADALTAFENSVVSIEPSRRRILAYAAQGRLATIFGSRYFAAEGALIAHGINFAVLHRRAAYYVDRILKGTKPADLPVEQPVAFNLVVNSVTAKALGLTIPPAILARADEVIE